MMKHFSLFLLIGLFFASGFSILTHSTKKNANLNRNPGEDYLLSRQYPAFGEGILEYKAAVAKELNRLRKNRSVNTPWQQEGPYNVGGRINCIAIHPTLANTYLVGTADGGIWKTTDDGANWVPIFDTSTSLSVSSIEFNTSNPSIIYAGTGDHVLGGYSHMGNGMYKSLDGGNTWTNIGLTNTGTIGKIIIDPTNPSIIYASTTGNPFISDANRGVYKSIDGGATWNNILFLGQNAGVADLVINASNPSILYATGRRRIRSDVQSILSGPEARIYRTTNAGVTWDTLTNGLPSGDQCRIGLCISNSNPNLLYANYVDTSLDFGGLYKTTNGGNTWTLVNNSLSGSMGGFGWYFGEIRMDPSNNNVLYMLNVSLYKSSDGGATFTTAGASLHSDKHDLKFVNSNTLLLGTDGGFYKSSNAGSTWTNKNNFPITQFYEVAYNPFDTSNYYGGAQDNGTNYGSKITGLSNWLKLYGADGFRPQFNNIDDQVFYVEWQNGNVMGTDNGGLNFTTISQSIINTDRCSWNTPYMVSRFNPDVLYLGSYKVYKNTSGPIDNWVPISNDLTNGTNDAFHVITTIDQSPLNAQVLYAGTSDANVWITQNDGGSWTLINAGLSNRNISCVLASPDDVSHVFVSQTGYRNNDSTAHLYFSTNYGSTWTNIAGNLPNFAINDIWVKAGSHDSSILIANDGGVYATKNRGVLWERVGNNMPIMPVYDLEYNEGTQRIIAGTFARSMMTMRVDSIFKTKVSYPELVSENNTYKGCKVYPNPCHDEFSIDLGNATLRSAVLYSMHGTVIRRYNEHNNLSHFDCKGIHPGYYILSILTSKGRVNQSILIQ